MNSMMETMTMTRRAMWRFRAARMLCPQEFLFISWVGRKVWPPPSPELGTSKAFTNSGEGFENHMWF